MATNPQDLKEFRERLTTNIINEGRKYESFSFEETIDIFYFIKQVEDHISKETPDKASSGTVINYWKWRIGITDNLEERKKAYESPQYNDFQHLSVLFSQGKSR